MNRGRALVVAMCVAPVLSACSGSSSTPPPTAAAPTPVGKIDAAHVRLVRAGFCDQVPDAAVRRALDGKAAADASWGNGDPVPNGSGSGEVGHEIGCAWTGAGTAARAWVFARPVAADFAGTLVAAAGRQPGCTAQSVPVFGRPALIQTCSEPGGVQRVRRAGLFGDTWLTCEVSGPAGTPPRTRLDPWCAAVVAALAVS